ncbi:hypothetical protein M6B38_305780 [Iris pallida]|uniref:Uncharacterized protein n=1 Tax=Iris pallida TaxID=29817 RepID=A0AAX6HM06_IRIPA|nr:hypothetical protein M6B38_305780 [Iris pallida]
MATRAMAISTTTRRRGSSLDGDPGLLLLVNGASSAALATLATQPAGVSWRRSCRLLRRRRRWVISPATVWRSMTSSSGADRHPLLAARGPPSAATSSSVGGD